MDILQMFFEHFFIIVFIAFIVFFASLFFILKMISYRVRKKRARDELLYRGELNSRKERAVLNQWLYSFALATICSSVLFDNLCGAPLFYFIKGLTIRSISWIVFQYILWLTICVGIPASAVFLLAYMRRGWVALLLAMCVTLFTLFPVILLELMHMATDRNYWKGMDFWELLVIICAKVVYLLFCARLLLVNFKKEMYRV